MTDTSRLYFDQNFALLWSVKFNCLDGKRFARPMGDGGTCLHEYPPRKRIVG